MLNLFIILAGIAFMLRGWGIKGGKLYYSLAFALSVYFVEDSIAKAMFSFPMALLAISGGWGKWVGAILDNYINPNVASEDKEFDSVIKGVDDKPRLWGTLGLTYRGASMGLMMGAALLNGWMVLAGAAMGLCFLVASFVPSNIDRWKIGEFLVGCALGAALIYG